MKLSVTVDGRAGDLMMERTSGGVRFEYSSERGGTGACEASMVEVEPGIYSVLLNGQSYEVKVVPGPGGYYVDLGGHRTVIEVRDPRSVSRQARQRTGEGRQTISAPMPGKVVRVLVREGDEVQAGDGLVVVEAMKMQNELKAPKAGRVVQLKAVVGSTVGHGEMLAAVE